MEPTDPVSGGDRGPRTWPVVLGVLAAVGAVVTLAVLTLVPTRDGDSGDEGVSSEATGTTDRDTEPEGRDDPEPQVSPETTTSAPSAPLPGPTTTGVPIDLFGGGFPTAFADLLAAAGGPEQAVELSVYPDYAFLAYRDPADPAVVDRREWRGGEVGDASANPIHDRVDADTEPLLFPVAELDPTLLAQLIADAVLHYDVPTAVTHVIVNRFLPFDDRVLVRVYASPTDGRSGGGYVSYDTAGALVRVCC